MEVAGINAQRAKHSRRMPVVLTGEEVGKLMRAVKGDAGMVCRLLYGCGLSVAEGLALPGAFAEKQPRAGETWPWFWLFPAGGEAVDPRSGVRRRHHIHGIGISRELGRVTAHALRHSVDSVAASGSLTLTLRSRAA